MELSLEIVSNIKSLLEKNQYTLFDAFLESEGSTIFLRVYAQNSSGTISLEDCVKISSFLTQFLDENDPIEEQYILEIASPGVIKYLRTLSLMQEELGNKVSVILKNKDKNLNSKVVVGVLKYVDSEKIVVNEQEIEQQKIKKIETYYKF